MHYYVCGTGRDENGANNIGRKCKYYRVPLTGRASIKLYANVSGDGRTENVNICIYTLPTSDDLWGFGVPFLRLAYMTANTVCVWCSFIFHV